MVAGRITLAVPALAIGVCACSGKPRAPEEAVRSPTAGDATAAGTARTGDATAPLPDDAAAGAGSGTGSGDLQVRVEWPDVPAAARSSPGRTPCGTPRAPSVSPTTTWGVPEALVIVEGAPPPAQAVARVALADCAIAPHVVAGSALAITSTVDHPVKLVLRKRGDVDQVLGKEPDRAPARLAPGDPVTVMLPIAGHTVEAALDPGAIYTLETDAPEPELAFAAAVSARVTDASGHAQIAGLSPGAHAITAWLPPRAGQPPRIGHGTATVSSGELTEVTVTLAPSP